MKRLRFLLLALLLLAPAASRADDAMFTVSPVAVDVTAESAAAARDAAIAEGQRRAFETVLSRMTIPEDRAALPALTDDDISGFVQNFEVISEKSSPVRYVGSLTIRFSPDAVSEYLRSHNVSTSSTPSQPMLIIPVMGVENRLLLWEDDNAWRAAWGRVSGSGTELLPVVVPLGDAQDMADISAEAALSGDNDAIRRIASRYGAGGDAIVAVVAATGGQDAPLSRLAVQVMRIAPGGGIALRNIDIVRKADETDDALLDRAAAATLSELRIAWKEETGVEPIAPRDLDVVAVVPALADWAALEKTLIGAPRVSGVFVVGFARGQVRFRLSVAGDIEKFREGLMSRGLLFLPTGTGYEIRKR